MLRGFCLWLLPSFLKKKMRYPPISFLRPSSIRFIASFVILFLGCLTANISLCLPIIPSSLETLSVDGHFSFHGIEHAARDFGNRYQFLPQAVLHPKSVSDIATTIKHVWRMGPGSELTVAARGHGHSLQGQAQAHQGVVINMESLQGTEMQVYTGNFPYVDVSGGELWINILHESLLNSDEGFSSPFSTGEMDPGPVLRFLHICQRPGISNILLKHMADSSVAFFDSSSSRCL